MVSEGRGFFVFRKREKNSNCFPKKGDVIEMHLIDDVNGHLVAKKASNIIFVLL